MTQGNRRYLAIYLNDHLAGAAAGLALTKRIRDSARGEAYRERMTLLVEQIAEDRTALLSIMGQLDVEASRLKPLLATIGERVGRGIPNGHLFKRSPLTPVVELEGLCLGIHGKRKLWEVLRETRADELDTETLDLLVERARKQAALVEEIRLAAARNAFDGPDAEATTQ